MRGSLCRSSTTAISDTIKSQIHGVDAHSVVADISICSRSNAWQGPVSSSRSSPGPIFSKLKRFY